MDASVPKPVAQFNSVDTKRVNEPKRIEILARLVIVAARALLALGAFCVIGGILALVWLFFKFMNSEPGDE